MSPDLERCGDHLVIGGLGNTRILAAQSTSDLRDGPCRGRFIGSQWFTVNTKEDDSMMFPLLRFGGCGKNVFPSIGVCRWTLWRVSKLRYSSFNYVWQSQAQGAHAPNESRRFKLHWYIIWHHSARIFHDFSDWLSKSNCMEWFWSKNSQPGYNFLKRMQPHQETPLRPILDADDDLWLDAARQLYPVLSRAQVPVASLQSYFVDLWAALSVSAPGLLLPAR